MTKLLKNIQISEISLVPVGANGAEFIAKTGEGAILVTIRKTDAAKQIAVGIVYAPEQPDSQDEMATAAEIEKAAWDAMKNHAVVKTDHAELAPAFLAESYLVKKDDPDGFPEGAWAVVVKIEDDALWQQVEKGDFKAFSMGGKAEKEPLEKKPESVEKEISIDSMAYATGLQDVLALVNGIAQNLGNVVKETAQLAKSLGGDQAELVKKVDAVGTDLDTVKSTVAKIAEQLTDGRLTSAEPGAPGNDPGKY